MAKYKPIIDADGIVYRVGFAMEEVDSLRVVKDNVQSILDEYLETLTKIFVSLDSPTIVLSPVGEDNNFRFKVAKTLPYKGNRKQPKPKHYEFIRENLLAMDGALLAEGQEADDTIADLAALDYNKSIIVSQDKDMRQVPGHHFEPGEKRPMYFVDPLSTGIMLFERTTGDKGRIFATGQMQLYAQMMLGDTSDNIPGLKGYGDTKVYNILGPMVNTSGATVDHVKELERVVKLHYQDMGCLDRYNEVYTLLKIGGHNVK